ncbi:MAG: hypothetical protein K0S75_844 [Clostridia bacterium]|jgi:hypothetical protein|nr:hypothetical protein [Clostridia bacterium]
MDEKVKAYIQHFNDGYSQEIIDYATNVMLEESRYVFVTTIKKQQYGYCTHCYSEFKTHLKKPTERQKSEVDQCGCHAAYYYNSEYEKQKHGQSMECPVCKSKCKVRYSGLGHSRLLDSSYFVYYEKSVLDPKIIVARGFLAWRDYTADYKNVKTNLHTDYYYIFEYSKGGKMIKWIDRWQAPSGWGFTKTVYSRLHNQAPSTVTGYSKESIKTAVKDTPFAWSGWELCEYEDMVRFFDFYARYPVVEYLNKLGYRKLILSRLKGDNTFNTINWRGKTLLKVFKLTDEEYQMIKQQKIIPTFWFLHLIKLNKDKGLGLSIIEVKQLSEMIYGIGEIDTIGSMTCESFTFKDAIRYISKQLRNSNRTYYGTSNVVRDWMDYKQECKKLNIDTSEMRILYPNNLHSAHQNTSAQIKYAEDLALTEKIKERLPDLKKFSFKYNGLFIRAAVSSQELVNEGKALNHCVGRYSKDYADGKTNILLIRKEREPDTPFYTLEVRGTTIYQTRGLRNCVATDEVQAFVDEFEAEVLLKKKKSKVKVPA